MDPASQTKESNATNEKQYCDPFTGIISQRRLRTYELPTGFGRADVANHSADNRNSKKDLYASLERKNDEKVDSHGA